MKTIWKYGIDITNELYITMPYDTRILSVHLQYGKPCIWAIIYDDKEIKMVSRKFRWFGTGHPIPEGEKLIYIGTVLMQNDSLVFHLFEVL